MSQTSLQFKFKCELALHMLLIAVEKVSRMVKSVENHRVVSLTDPCLVFPRSGSEDSGREPLSRRGDQTAVDALRDGGHCTRVLPDGLQQDRAGELVGAVRNPRQEGGARENQHSPPEPRGW